MPAPSNMRPIDRREFALQFLAAGGRSGHAGASLRGHRPGRVRRHRSTRRHGRDARWRAAGNGHLSAGEERQASGEARAGHSGAHAVRQVGKYPAPRERGDREHLREPRLRGGVSGLPRSREFAGRVRQVSERRAGRLRLLRVDREAAVEQRPHRHAGSLVRRAHDDCVGVSRCAGTRGDVHRLRRIRERVPGRHSTGRSVRAQAGHVGVQCGAGGAGDSQRSSQARGAGGRRHQGVVRAHAVVARPLAVESRAGVRGLRVRSMGARRFRRLLEAGRDLRRRARTIGSATCRSCGCRRGTTRIRAPRPTTTSRSRGASAVRSA